MHSRAISGSVLILRCELCAGEFPFFRFAAENDMETTGLAIASSCDRNEVVIAEMTTAEWNEKESGLSSLEGRLSKSLDRTDLRVIRLLEIRNEASALERFENFEQFNKQYKPPVLVFSCACCEKGRSVQVAENSVSGFRSSGGLVTLYGDITVSDSDVM